MSLGKQLIKAAIAAGSPSILKDIRPEFLLTEEQDLFQFVRQHVSQHGVLPTEETLNSNQLQLMRAREPASFYVAEMRKRYAFNQINERFPALTAAMRAHNMNEAEGLLRQAVQSIGSTLRPHSYSSLGDALTLVLEDFEYAKEHPGLRGVTFGWPSADEVTLGAVGGDLVVVAGRPSMGKSWLLGKSAHAAQRAGHSSIIISMEMPVLQLARRVVAYESGLNPHMVRKGQLSPWGENELRESIERLRQSSTPMHFLSGDFTKSTQGIADMANEFSPDIIYIDAAYLLSPSARQSGSVKRWEQLSTVIRELKGLGLDINRPIYITVQFNRNVRRDQKETKKLDLGDIGGTDAIPQDASIVYGVRAGYSPFEKTKRHVENLKCREGEIKDFVTNFHFYPIDFDESSYPNSEGLVNTEWMV